MKTINPDQKYDPADDVINEMQEQEDMKDIERSIHTISYRKWYWNFPHKINPDWECPICKKIMRDPVQLNGVKQHRFCRFCIKKWLSKSKKLTNPLTGEIVKADYTLVPDEDLKIKIANLYVSANKAQQDVEYDILPHGLGDYIEYSPQHAKVAKKFYEEHLEHLDADHQWGPWAKEKVCNLYQRALHNTSLGNNDNDNDYDDGTAYSLKLLDDIQKTAVFNINGMINDAKDKVTNASNNQERAAIIQGVQNDVSMYKKIVNAVISFLKTVWNVITFPFRTIGSMLKWLFELGASSNTQQNLNDAQNLTDPQQNLNQDPNLIR